jgi:Protein of unknown function (DUF1003)
MNSSPQRAADPVYHTVLVPLDGSTLTDGAIRTPTPSPRADGREGRSAVHDGMTVVPSPRGRRQPAHPRHPAVIRHPHDVHHPVVLEDAARRAASRQLRIADSITAFAGSMPFVYLHVVAFACWMLFIESDPWPRLTLVVSLEAIFLSTFVMIGQNRQAEFQRAKADHDFATEAQELRINTELTRVVHTLTTELHRHVLGGATEGEPPGERPDE